MKETTKTFYSTLTKYRMTLFGIAVIWIFFRHVYFFNIETYGFLDYVTQLGDCGVDVFLFLSGFGCFYSYKQKCDAIYFYKKRIIRIFPTTVILLVFFSLIDYCLGGGSLKSVFNPIAYIKSIYATYWFIGAIIVYYISFPIVYKLVLTRPIFFVLLAYVLAIGGVYLITFIDIGQAKSLALYFARIPIFVLGAVFARNNNLFERKTILLTLTIVCAPLLFLLPKDYQRIAYGIFSLGIISFLPYLIAYIPQKINEIVSCLGKSSFEFYIIHLFAFYHGLVKSVVIENVPIGGGLAFIVLAIISFEFHKIINYIQGKLKCFLM